MWREPGDVVHEAGDVVHDVERLPSPPGRRKPVDRCGELLDEVRQLVTTMGAELARASQQQSRAADLVARLSEQLARADRVQLAAPAFGDRFVERYLELQASIQAFGRLERSSGSPPEHTVIALKSLFEDARAAGLSAEAAVVVERDMVRWGIDAYYAA